MTRWRDEFKMWAGTSVDEFQRRACRHEMRRRIRDMSWHGCRERKQSRDEGEQVRTSREQRCRICVICTNTSTRVCVSVGHGGRQVAGEGGTMRKKKSRPERGDTKAWWKSRAVCCEMQPFSSSFFFPPLFLLFSSDVDFFF